MEGKVVNILTKDCLGLVLNVKDLIDKKMAFKGLKIHLKKLFLM